MIKPTPESVLFSWAEGSSEVTTPTVGKLATGFTTGPEGQGEAPYYQHMNRIFQNLFRHTKEGYFHRRWRDEVWGSATATTDENNQATLYQEGANLKNAGGVIQTLTGAKRILVQDGLALSADLDLSSLEVEWEMENLSGALNLNGFNLTLGNCSGRLKVQDDSQTPGQVILKGLSLATLIETDGQASVDASDPGFAGSYHLNGILTSARTLDLESRLSDAESQIATVNNQMLGMVAGFMVETPPSGWLECNGQNISRSTYANLFAHVGTSYGVGDGTTTFGLPDMRGYFVRGWANGSTNDPEKDSRSARPDGIDGDHVGTTQTDSFQGHWHSIYDPGHNHSVNHPTIDRGVANGQGEPPYLSGTGTVNSAPSTLVINNGVTNIGVRDPLTGNHGGPRVTNETRGKNIAMMFCIKH